MGGALAHGSPAVETGASPRALFSDAALPTTGLPTDDAPIAETQIAVPLKMHIFQLPSSNSIIIRKLTIVASDL